MIVSTIAIAVLTILLAITSFLPVSSTLPLGVDGTLYTVGQWMLQLRVDLWPLDIIFTIFFEVYLPFLFILMLLKFFLGHRAPGHHN